MELYPLTFQPIYKERLWGGAKLKTLLGKAIPDQTTGESWEISAVKDNVSVVTNGHFKGTSLQELVDTYPEQLLGKRIFNRFGTAFPILIKFIDAREKLSIQLHPDDTLAQKRHGSFGKTEMWYIMQANPGAQLIIGFNNTIGKATYQQHLKNNTLLQVLHHETVKEGDAFFIRPGKVHAIGEGILLAEIQQTSDITYRIFDFNRKDKDGKLRELHTELALEAIDYEQKDDFKCTYIKKPNTPDTVASCPYFTTKYLHITNEVKRNFAARDSFTIYMCTEGSVTLSIGNTETSLKKGDTILIPAAIHEITLHTTHAVVLEVYI